MTVREMIETHPQPTSIDRDALLRCIDECFECGATCTSCADACVGEKNVEELVRCIRFNLDCADACDATGRILTRQTEHCRVCAAACRRCEQACSDLLAAIGQTSESDRARGGTSR